MSINTEMTALADAIRNKSGVTGKLSIAAMTSAVGNIVINPGGGETVDLSFVTATAGDILSGKVGADVNGNPVYGTLEVTGGSDIDLSGVTVTADKMLAGIVAVGADGQKVTGNIQTVAASSDGEYVTIPAGFHPTEQKFPVTISGDGGDSDIVFGYLDIDGMFQALDLSGDEPVKIGAPEEIDQFTTYIVPDPGIEPFRLSLKNETDEASVHLILEQTGVGEGADYYEINATEYLNDSIFYRTQDNREWRLLEVDASDAKKSITINLSSNNTYVEFLNETSVWGGEKLWYTFEMQGDDVVASRNIMALIHNNDLYPYCFNGTFRNCTNLVSAPELPATELAQYCYRWMFEGCTSLTTAPKLPAESMALYCYAAMFQGCTSLVSAPKLPATELAGSCYAAMFQGCTSLVHPPEFPQYVNDRLSEGCYAQMFEGCVSLEHTPQISLERAPKEACRRMFYGCTSLTGASDLPATYLFPFCYDQMFYGCTSLTAPPQLPATELAEGCYRQMFQGCTNLGYIIVRFTEWLHFEDGRIDATYNWLANVKDTGKFYKPSALEAEKGGSRIPIYWNVTNIGGN